MADGTRSSLWRPFLRRFLPVAPVGALVWYYVVGLTGTDWESALVGAGILGALAVGAWGWARSDATHLSAEREILHRLELSDQILNSVRELVLVADKNGSISYASSSVKTMLGYEPEEVLGDGWWQVTREDPGEREDEKTTAARHARGKDVGEWTAPYDRVIRHRDGSTRWIRWRESPGPGRTIVGIGSDVTAQKEVEEARKRLVALIENTSEFVAYARPEGGIEFINPGGRRLVGFGMDADPATVRMEDVVATEDRHRFLTEILPEVTSGETWSGELRFGDLAGGPPIAVHGSIFPVVDEGSGDLLAVGGTFMDLRAQKELEENLVEALQRAEEASKAKQQFLANMSHEIRTPMNAIIGMADLLWETPLTDDQRDYVQVFRTAGETLLGLINDILDLAKVEEGRLDLEKVGFNLLDLVESTVEVFAVPAQKKGLEIGARIDPGVPPWVLGDPGRIRQILSNLIGNAVKFTESGEVLVEVEGSADSSGEEAEGREASAVIRFSVSDTGEGIPAERLESVFDRFTQVDSSTTRRFGGSGLGLAICEKLVSLMDGRIWVESEAGKGSTFHFTLQFPLTEAPREESVDTSDLTDLHTIVVDDSGTNRLILREILTSWGMRVEEAVDGTSALTMMREATAAGTPFRLALLDGQMGEMDGYEVAAQLRDDPSFGRPRAIILTSHGDPVSQETVRALGLSGHMMKPVRRPTLLHAIGKAVGGRRLFQPGEGERTSATREQEPGPSLRILVVDDSEDNRTLLGAYLKKTPHRAVYAENGEEAVAAFCSGSEFDLVLMDIQMPVMDGHTATRAIRGWEREQGREPTRIYALSAHALEEEINESLSAGCDDHLTKPIRKKVLLDALSDLGRELESGVREGQRGFSGRGEP
jgi:PAS domain S-box-containing protein